MTDERRPDGTRQSRLETAVDDVIGVDFYGALVLHRRATDSALGLSLRTAGLVAAMLPATAAMLGLSVAALEIGFRAEIGVSRMQLIADAAKAAATERAAPL
jgi:hypothetical protein